MKNTIEDLDPWLAGVLHETDRYLYHTFGERLKRVVLYGSYARGDNEPDSDIDIIAFVDDEQASLDTLDDSVTEIAIDLTTKYGVLVSLYIESLSTYHRYRSALPFLQNVDKEGIVIYDC